MSPVFLPRPSRDVHRQCSTSRLTKSHFCKEFTLHTHMHMHISRAAAPGWGLAIGRCPFPHAKTVQPRSPLRSGCACVVVVVCVRRGWGGVVTNVAHSADHFNSSTRAGIAAVPSVRKVRLRPTGCVTAILPL